MMKDIYNLRKDLHLTQAQLGKILGKCRNTIHTWEQDEVMLDEDAVVGEMKRQEKEPVRRHETVRLPCDVCGQTHSVNRLCKTDAFERTVSCKRCTAKFFTEEARREHARIFHRRRNFWEEPWQIQV